MTILCAWGFSCRGGYTLEPVRKTERIEALDILRGFALFGVFAVNITGFSGPEWLPGFISPEWRGLDAVADFIVEHCMLLKFFTLFSFLFGAGFAVQMGRAEASGRDIGSFYPRRLIALFCFGLLHHILAWDLDILKLYALLGFVLLLFRKASDTLILVTALLSWVLGSAGYLVQEMGSGMEELFGLSDYLASAIRAFSGSGFLEAAAFRVRDMPHTSANLVLEQGGIAFAMFMTGLYVGRKGYLSRLDSLTALPWLVLASGIAGLAFTVLHLGLASGIAATIAAAFANLALTAFYASGILFLSGRPARSRILSFLSAGGRMALTNYIMQSVMASLVFYGYGLGLYGTVGPAARLGIVLVLYCVQLAASTWWLGRFRYGPLEWVWRGLTYGKLSVLRRENAPATGDPS